MTSPETHEEFALSSVLTPPSPGTSGTTLVLQSGDGAKFSSATPYNVTVWPAGTVATSANAEIVRVTGLTGDTMTVTRAQQGTTPQDITAGYHVAVTVNASTVTDVKGAVARCQANVYSVKDSAFGAAGDGSTDDTAAIQAAINAANSAGGGCVYYPAGTYKLTSALTIHSGITFLGDGRQVSIIRQTSTSANGISGNDASYLHFQDLQIQGPGRGTGIGVNLGWTSNNNVYGANFTRVYVRQFGGDGIRTENQIVSVYNQVVSESNGGCGFKIIGKSGVAGTSLTFNSCYANANTGTAGYLIDTMAYLSFNACAADTNSISYLIQSTTGGPGRSQSIIFNGCGSEFATVGGWQIDSGYGITVNNAWFNTNDGYCIWVTGSAHTVSLSGCTENTAGGCATDFIKVDSGCSVTMNQCNNITANSLADGTTITLNDGGGDIAVPGRSHLGNQVVASGSSAAGMLFISNAVSTSTEPGNITVQEPDSNSPTMGVYVAGDAHPRFTLRADGAMQWGPGSALLDSAIYRNAAGQLKTDSAFLTGQWVFIGTTLEVGGDITSDTGRIVSASPTSGVGYKAGAGGAVSQPISKKAGVTLDNVSGRITMNDGALAAGTIVSFALTNAAIAPTDVLILNHVSGGTAGAYTLNAQAAAGSATINVRNNTADSLSEPIVIQFAVIKAVDT